MYGMKLEGKVGGISADVKVDDNVPLRRDTLSLHFEFGKEFASALNKHATQLQKLLRDGELSAARMPVDYKLVLECSDGKGTMSIQAEAGKLEFKAPNKEDANPQAKLSVIIPTEDESHMWFVKHLNETIDVTINTVTGKAPRSEEQQELTGA